MAETSAFLTFAEDELRRAGLFDEDSDYGGMMGEAVMKMCRVFSEEGHSGFSASMAIAVFSKVAKFEPLTPLTGDDDEWVEVEPGLFQNNRCSRVFKDEDGAYDIDGRIFRDQDGLTYTNRDSRVPVTFPYTPESEIVDRPA